jgi:hypothetical protein
VAGARHPREQRAVVFLVVDDEAAGRHVAAERHGPAAAQKSRVGRHDPALLRAPHVRPVAIGIELAQTLDRNAGRHDEEMRLGRRPGLVRRRQRTARDHYASTLGA